MKIVYASFIDVTIKEMIGVHKKIAWQVNAMRELGNHVIHGYCNNTLYTLHDGLKEHEFQLNSTNKFTLRRSMYKALEEYVLKVKPDVIYMRFVGCDPYFILLLKKIKKHTKKIILEVPTYPISREIISLLKMHWRNNEFRHFKSTILKSLALISSIRFLKKYVDFIVTYMNFEEIWRIPVIQIDNGVCVEQVPVKKNKHNNSNEIVLIGVAGVSLWHGYDRVLEGLIKYIKEKQNNKYVFRFKIVGQGPELKKLKQIVKDNSLDEYVEFPGLQTGKELDLLYDSADVAISSLGLHRIGLKEGSTLKTKEYCARGLPFIYAYKEKGLSKDESFSLLIPADESSVDINKLIEFVNNYRQDLHVKQRMRQFALENYDWKIQMKYVIEKII